MSERCCKIPDCTSDYCCKKATCTDECRSTPIIWDDVHETVTLAVPYFVLRQDKESVLLTGIDTFAQLYQGLQYKKELQ